MLRIANRTVAVLLASCLLVDPAAAQPLNASAVGVSSAHALLFSDQALAASALNTIRAKWSQARLFWVRTFLRSVRNTDEHLSMVIDHTVAEFVQREIDATEAAQRIVKAIQTMERLDYLPKIEMAAFVLREAHAQTGDETFLFYRRLLEEFQRDMDHTELFEISRVSQSAAPVMEPFEPIPAWDSLTRADIYRHLRRLDSQAQKEFGSRSGQMLAYANILWRLRSVEGTLQNKRILDVGSAEGDLVWILKRFGLEAEGIDNEPSFVDRAQRLGRPVYFGDLTSPNRALLDHPFDVVFSRYFPIVGDPWADADGIQAALQQGRLQAMRHFSRVMTLEGSLILEGGFWHELTDSHLSASGISAFDRRGDIGVFRRVEEPAPIEPLSAGGPQEIEDPLAWRDRVESVIRELNIRPTLVARVLTDEGQQVYVEIKPQDPEYDRKVQELSGRRQFSRKEYFEHPRVDELLYVDQEGCRTFLPGGGYVTWETSSQGAFRLTKLVMNPSRRNVLQHESAEDLVFIALLNEAAERKRAAGQPLTFTLNEYRHIADLAHDQIKDSPAFAIDLGDIRVVTIDAPVKTESESLSDSAHRRMRRRNFLEFLAGIVGTAAINPLLPSVGAPFNWKSLVARLAHQPDRLSRISSIVSWLEPARELVLETGRAEFFEEFLGGLRKQVVEVLDEPVPTIPIARKQIRETSAALDAVASQLEETLNGFSDEHPLKNRIQQLIHSPRDFKIYLPGRAGQFAVRLSFAHGPAEAARMIEVELTRDPEAVTPGLIQYIESHRRETQFVSINSAAVEKSLRRLLNGMDLLPAPIRERLLQNQELAEALKNAGYDVPEAKPRTVFRAPVVPLSSGHASRSVLTSA